MQKSFLFCIFLSNICGECVTFAIVFGNARTRIMDTVLSQAIISIGSNVPDKKKRVENACEELKSLFPSFESSPIYTTGAVGRCTGQPDYCNAVARLSTSDDYEALKKFFKEKESEYGRVHDGSRTTLVPLDIDIVVWNGAVMRPRDMQQEYMRIGLEMLHLL